MTRTMKLVGRAAAAVALLVGACQNDRREPPAADTAAAVPATVSALLPAEDPLAELAGLDHRQAVPLQPMMAWHQKQNMMEHLVAIEGITEALAREDWEAVATASSLIESSPAMQQMCEHMGAGADGFTDRSLDFHRRADAIGDAARARDATAVLRATANTLAACTGCHATYRQEVVDSATWQGRTGQTHDPMMMLHGSD